MIANEQAMLAQYNDTAQDLKRTHVADRTAKDARWPNYYNDLDPLPVVDNDMDAQARQTF
jgi:hypothetical protein